jgi:hypothetical protein
MQGEGKRQDARRSFFDFEGERDLMAFPASNVRFTYHAFRLAAKRRYLDAALKGCTQRAHNPGV